MKMNSFKRLLIAALSVTTCLAAVTVAQCPTYKGCNVYDHWLSTIDPCCCEDTTTTCQNYKVEQWQCAAGATRYRYFGPSGAPMPGFACDGTACY